MIPPVHVGERFGRLTVTSVRPFLMLCDCGTMVRDRVAHHVTRNRLRSCGCLKREKTEVPHTSFRWSEIRCVNPDEKVHFQRFDVTCVQCNRPSVVCYASVTSTKETRGCKLCVQDAQEAKRARERLYIIRRDEARRAADDL